MNEPSVSRIKFIFLAEHIRRGARQRSLRVWKEGAVSLQGDQIAPSFLVCVSSYFMLIDWFGWIGSSSDSRGEATADGVDDGDGGEDAGLSPLSMLLLFVSLMLLLLLLLGGTSLLDKLGVRLSGASAGCCCCGSC